VEVASSLAEPASQLGLDCHVHVLFADGDEGATVGISPELHQPGVDRRRRRVGDDSLARQHEQMGQRAEEILSKQSSVQLQRAGEGQHFGEEGRPARRIRLGDHAPPPCSRLYSWSWSPRRVMKPSAARWSNWSSRP
jgi:hypothetical protein